MPRLIAGSTLNNLVLTGHLGSDMREAHVPRETAAVENLLGALGA